jgi:nucleoside-diphosphate kinase
MVPGIDNTLIEASLLSAKVGLRGLRKWSRIDPRNTGFWRMLFMERTLILLKPDCVQRRLAGRVLSRFEDKGFNIVALKMMRISPALAKQHYAEHVAKGWYPTLEKFITGGPIVAGIVEGLEAIRVVREMLGATSGLKAAAGTIRGDFSSSRQMNLVHASDGPEAALREMSLYFKPEEIIGYEPTITPWLRAGDET